MATVVGLLILIGAIGCVVLIGIALAPFFVGALLTVLAMGAWQHIGGAPIEVGSTGFWWVYGICTVVSFAVMHGGKSKS